MKIEINDAFQKIVTNAARFAAAGVKSAQMTVYSCVKVAVQGGTATVSSANGYAFYSASAPGFGMIDGSFIVDAHLFSGALARFSNGTVENTENALTFKKGRQKFSMATYSAMDMPEAPSEKEIGVLTLDAKVLLAALDTVAYAMSKNDTRPSFESVHITSKDGKLRFDAVDGFRIGRCVLPIPAENIDILLPAWVVKQVLSDELLKEAENVIIFSDAKHVGVSTDTMKIVSNALSGDALDADKVFCGAANSACCDTAMLMEILKTSKLVQATASADAKLPIVLEILPDEQKISVHLSTSTAALSDELPLIGEESTAAALKIGLNAAFLTEAMQHVSSSEMQISYSQALAPITIRPYVKEANGVEVVHLILPVRLKDGQ